MLKSPMQRYGGRLRKIAIEYVTLRGLGQFETEISRNSRIKFIAVHPDERANPRDVTDGDMMVRDAVTERDELSFCLLAIRVPFGRASNECDECCDLPMRREIPPNNKLARLSCN
ncbi:hypothetical protein Trydic_g6618 [Trypoxylus dichotomus]